LSDIEVNEGALDAKRLFDIAASAAALLVLAPILLIVAIAVRLALGRPVLFRQVRPGLGGRPFELVKFRTMLPERSADGKELDDAARLTRFGRLLRSTSLDELPQLWNVLLGDMSLVGPRPLLMEYLDLYTPEQARRHEVRPGVTGWSQVNGRNALSWADKFELDVWYVDNHSFMLDLRILLMTVGQVVSRRGIGADETGVTSKFSGSDGEPGPNAATGVDPTSRLPRI
jgi:sugar transferase EpsL